jgi:hypothetical protein
LKRKDFQPDDDEGETMIRDAYPACSLACLLALSVAAADPAGTFAAATEETFFIPAQAPAAGNAGPGLPQAGFTEIPPAGHLFRDASIRKDGELVDINVHYPVFGNALIDRDISLWARRVAETFSNGLARDSLLPRQVRNELKVDYTVSYASPRSLTVTYEVWTYTGGAHGNNDVITLSYDVESGQRIFFEDLVVATDTALETLADYCLKALTATLGEDLNEEMLRNGTMPEVDNYSSFSLFPAGLRIHFQPYQVAPFSAGPQRVDVPLEIIMEAGPRLEFWGRDRR